MVPTLVDKCGEASATIAAQWYEDMRAQQVEGSDYIATTGDMLPSEAVQQSIRWRADSLWGDEEQMQRFLRNSVDRWVKYSGRSTIMQNASRDTKKVRFALVPRGKTCAWCTMLASRDFTYTSEESVKAAQHSHCDCWPCPMWDAKKAFISGYDPEQMEKDYQAARDELDKAKKGEGAYAKAYKTDKTTGSNVENDIAWFMRRMKPNEYTDGKHVDNRQTRDSSLSYATYADYRSSLAEKYIKLNDPHAQLPPKEPAEAPQDWPKDLPKLRAREWNHILYGSREEDKNIDDTTAGRTSTVKEPKSYTYSGGHSAGYGWIHQGSEFPDSWDSTKIANAIEDVMRSATQTGNAFLGEHDGVKMIVRVSKGRVITAYPVRR